MFYMDKEGLSVFAGTDGRNSDRSLTVPFLAKEL